MERERLKDQAAMEEGLVGAGSGESTGKRDRWHGRGEKTREHKRDPESVKGVLWSGKGPKELI